MVWGPDRPTLDNWVDVKLLLSTRPFASVLNIPHSVIEQGKEEGFLSQAAVERTINVMGVWLVEGCGRLCASARAEVKMVPSLGVRAT
jgi:hypothetical protein